MRVKVRTETFNTVKDMENLDKDMENQKNMVDD